MIRRAALAQGLQGTFAPGEIRRTTQPIQPVNHASDGSTIGIIVFDAEGRLAAVRVFWAYDEFYSMLLIEDAGLDPDHDGEIEQSALDAFAGTDVDWEAGFPGDLYLTHDGAAVALAGPVDHGARYQDGRIITFHTRPLESTLRVDATPLTAKVYDQTFFVAYDVTLPVTLEGADDCTIIRDPADLEEASRILDARIDAMPDDGGLENDFPEVGEYYADAFRLTCSAGS